MCRHIAVIFIRWLLLSLSITRTSLKRQSFFFIHCFYSLLYKIGRFNVTSAAHLIPSCPPLFCFNTTVWYNLCMYIIKQMDLNTGGSFGELHCTCDLRVVFLIKLINYLKYFKNILQTVGSLCHQNVNLNTEYVPCQMFHATPMKKNQIFNTLRKKRMLGQDHASFNFSSKL